MICLLDVPHPQTGTSFTKPVDPILAQALDAWQATRPDRPKFTVAAPANSSTCCSSCKPGSFTGSPRSSTRRSGPTTLNRAYDDFYTPKSSKPWLGSGATRDGP